MEGQDSFIMRQPEDVANQASTELISEVPTEEAPLRFMDQDVFYHQPLSLD